MGGVAVISGSRCYHISLLLVVVTIFCLFYHVLVIDVFVMISPRTFWAVSRREELVAVLEHKTPHPTGIPIEAFGAEVLSPRSDEYFA